MLEGFFFNSRRGIIMNIKDCTFYPALSSQSDLAQFKNNALLLFTLQIRFNIDDIVTTGTASITDSADDKKIDLIYIDEDKKIVVIAQSYISTDLNKKSAPANKASDLNTGISWLLNREIDSLPNSLKSQAIELRHLLKDDNIDSFYAWYVHNLPESENVKQEMLTVDQTINSAIKTNFSESNLKNIYSFEIGIKTIEDWYKSILTPILVDDKFTIEIPGGYVLKHNDWEGFVTSISADWLYQIYRKFGSDLFSANVREYLGSRKSDANINYGIKYTAENEPKNFWIYNNGLTVLVHNFRSIKMKDKHSLEIEGISIVNGAQTTGAIGSLNNSPSSVANIPVRFIKCTNQDLIYNIVRYNNSQNKITAPDFRSNDSIQRRLVMEFNEIPGIEYSARRGGQDDIIRQRPNLIASVTAGQALASLNNDPEVAYHKKNKIWEDDVLYTKYFNDSTNARNIIYAYSLLKTIEERKIQLVNKSKSEDLTESESMQLEFFRKRGSIHMYLSAISKSLEIFLDKPIPSLLKTHFKKNLKLSEAIAVWEPIIDSVNPFVNYLSEGLSDGFRNTKAVDSAVKAFVSLVEATKQANKKVFIKFKNQVI
jgi:hypothetical protein